MTQEDADRLYIRMKACMERGALFLREDFCREDLARQMKTNRTYLSTALRVRHMTFNQFVNSFRAQYAIELILKEKDISVEDLAFRSGFSSARAMNRYIKQSAGLTAHALRYRIFGESVRVQP